MTLNELVANLRLFGMVWSPDSLQCILVTRCIAKSIVLGDFGKKNLQIKKSLNHNPQVWIRFRDRFWVPQFVVNASHSGYQKINAIDPNTNTNTSWHRVALLFLVLILFLTFVI